MDNELLEDIDSMLPPGGEMKVAEEKGFVTMVPRRGGDSSIMMGSLNIENRLKEKGHDVKVIGSGMRRYVWFDKEKAPSGTPKL